MSKPIVVGITGGSGSGKTRFINQLAKRVENVSLLSMDNYYHEITKQPVDSNGVENFDKLESINLEKFVADIKSLIDGKTVELPEYTFNNKSAEPKIISISSQPVILVEGIFTLYLSEVRDLTDLNIYIDAPDFLMVKRRILRDARERGYDLEDVLYRFEHHVTPAFKRYIEPSKQWADLIVPNHVDFDRAINIVSTYLKQSS
ncbi:MAG: uridine kinase [Ekhidna sp.]